MHYNRLADAGKKGRSKRLDVSKVNAILAIASVQVPNEVVLTVAVAQQPVAVKFVLQSNNNWLEQDSSRVFRIVLEESVPLRQPKAQVEFNLDMLHRVRDCHKVLGNAVLFKCNTCSNRFVTWHPNHRPSADLDVCKGYPKEVHTETHGWDGPV